MANAVLIRPPYIFEMVKHLITGVINFLIGISTINGSQYSQGTPIKGSKYSSLCYNRGMVDVSNAVSIVHTHLVHSISLE